MTAKLDIKVNNLWAFIAKSRPRIEVSLRENLPIAPPSIETRFNEAVQYAVFPGGKRLRPVLTMLGAELLGGDLKDVINAAVAVEFIHTSSLIFDDLPCMDDSPSRRDKLSLHEKFGEGLSTLVAIGFLNQSYHLVTLDGNGRHALDAVREIVDCVGPSGMVGGQSVDLMIATANECKICSRAKFGGVLNRKTSSLIRLALRLGAILSGAKPHETKILSDFAESLGHAYQISDDIIDLKQDAIVFENGNGKAEVNRAVETLAKRVAEAKSILTDNLPASIPRQCLIELVDYVAERKN